MDDNFAKIRQKALADAFKALMDFTPMPDEPTEEDLKSNQPKYKFLQNEKE